MIDLDLAILIAKIDIWLQALLPAVVLVIYVLNQLLSGAGKTGAKGLPQQRQRNRPPQGRQDVNDEVRDFLQRASERRSETRPPPSQPEVSRPARRLQQQAIEIVDAEVIDEAPTGGGVRSPLTPHLSTREFDQRPAQLDQGEKSDRAMQSHLHKVFDHRLGTLAPAATADPASVQDEQQVGDVAMAPNTASDFMALLRNPIQVRQAIIMNEILRRPEDRW